MDRIIKRRKSKIAEIKTTEIEKCLYTIETVSHPKSLMCSIVSCDKYYQVDSSNSWVKTKLETTSDIMLSTFWQNAFLPYKMPMI